MKRTNERFGRIARKGLGALALGLLLLTGCLEQEEAGSEVPSRLGINFIAEKRAENAGLDGTAGMLDDLADLGAGCIRQANGQDVCWFTIYQGGDYGDPDSYDFSGSDELILGSAARGIQVIPTLFQIGGDSAVMNGAPDTKRLYTPDGEILKVTDVYEFLHGTRSKVIDYVTVVASRYRDHVQYFECANEVMAYGSYSANDYARLLICVKDALQAVDPDLKLVLGGLAGTEDVVFYHHLDWFEEVLEELEKLGGLDAIDVVNFHHYDEWKLLGAAVDALQEVMDRFGLGDLPILASEIGSSYVAAEGPAHTEDGSEEDQ
ncbi:MAG: hypothetical protein QF752_06195, partial [Planctomycetota bacterium]|nr:hypothetical protein [Planctomycetota bacterium]